MPVDQGHSLAGLAHFGLDRHAVTQQLVHRLVVAVQAAVVVVRLALQRIEHPADLRRTMAARGQPIGQQSHLDIAVAVTRAPVAQVAIAQLLAEQVDHPLLGGAFGLANGAHYCSLYGWLCPSYVLHKRLRVCGSGFIRENLRNADNIIRG
ncbi:hypothetical protein D3C85_1408910 [compost metagenome]